MGKRPLVWAHRGASGYMPENTLPSFRLAAEMHTEGIELDIQLTKDGRIVVIHDETLERTSNGSGWVKDHTYQELLGMQFDKTHPLGVPVKIPLMEEVIDLVKPYGTFINIELKTGIVDYPGIEEKILSLVREKEIEERVIYSSFNHYSMVKMKELDSHIRTALLYMDGPIGMPEYAKRLGADAVHPALYNLRFPHLMEEAEQLGLEVNTWTVNKKEYMEYCRHMGVHAVITNYPDQALEYLEAAE